MAIPWSVAKGCQKIQRLFGHLFLCSRFGRLLDHDSAYEFFPDHFLQHLLERFPLFFGQDRPDQKILALVCRHLLQIGPRFPVIRDTQLRPENVLWPFPPSLTAP